MPHHKSAKKRMKTSTEKRLVNRDNRASMRTAIKKFQAKAEGGEAQPQDLQGIYSVLDVQARKGVIPRARAARLKARLAARLPR